MSKNPRFHRPTVQFDFAHFYRLKSLLQLQGLKLYYETNLALLKQVLLTPLSESKLRNDKHVVFYAIDSALMCLMLKLLTIALAYRPTTYAAVVVMQASFRFHTS
jgi:hypothetical protein